MVYSNTRTALASYSLVRKGGLEPPWIAPPDPKSGASANSATFAWVLSNRESELRPWQQPICLRGVRGRAIASLQQGSLVVCGCSGPLVV